MLPDSITRTRPILGLGLALLLALPALAIAADEKKPAGDPYPLDTCAVAGSKLGSMGDPVIYKHDGREIRFCCMGCLPKFEADPDAYLEKVDAKIIDRQAKLYPLAFCIVTEDESLTGPDAEPVDLVYNNRLVRFCCKGCVRKFREDPATFLAKLDQAVIEAQSDAYPLATCVVSGEKLGSMGDPVSMVIGNRLVRLCCQGCVKSLKSDPVAAFAKLDAAGGSPGSAGLAAATTRPAAGGRSVSFNGLTTSIPPTWQPFPPTSGMRSLNARIPSEDGTAEAELIVYYFGTGGAGPIEANLDRWAKQFMAPGGGPVQATRKTMTVNGMNATIIEMAGSYQNIGAPAATPNQAAINAVVEAPAGPVYFKFVGDETVVKASRAAVMRMLEQLRPDGAGG